MTNSTTLQIEISPFKRLKSEAKISGGAITSDKGEKINHYGLKVHSMGCD